MNQKQYVVGYSDEQIYSFSFGIGTVIFCLIYILVVTFITEMDYKHYIVIILFSFMGLYALCLYFLMRPKVVVYETHLEYFPRWGKKNIIEWNQITSRHVERGNEFSYLIESKRTSSAFTLTYGQYGKELFKTSTSLPNAAKLDETIVLRLENLTMQENNMNISKNNDTI